MYDARGRICVHRYLGHVFYILHVEVNMVTKYKAAVFIIAAMFSSIASAAYTTMTIEGVQQANGVWTAAGVIDTQGFIRKTAQVSVYGKTASTQVAMRASIPAASASIKGIVGKLGPLAITAVGAYDLYNWMTSNGVSEQGGVWVFPPDNEIDSQSPYYGVCRATFNPSFVWSGYTLSQCVKTFCLVNGQPTPHYLTNAGSYIEIGCTTPNNKNAIFTPSKNNPIILTPVSPDFFSTLPDLSIPALNDGFAKLPQLSGQGIPISGLSFPPYSEWMGDPYFKDGNWWRDRMDISPSGTTSSPTRVRVDIGPVKIEGATNPGTVPETGPAGGTGGAPQPEKEKPTFCEANPMSIACAEMGELQDEKLEVEERPVDVSYTPWGSSTSQCPADKVIPLWDDQSITISYSPVCQFASLLRPLVIALAFVAAGFIVAGITRKGAES